MKYRKLLIIICLIFITAFLLPALTGDTIFINGNILTMDKNMNKATGLVILGNKIIAVGKTKDVLKLKGEKTRVVNLNGKTVIPGLHDAHLHFESGANLIMNRIDLRFMNKEQILQKVSEAVKSSPAGALIKAYSYNHAYFKDKKWPDKFDLDKVTPNNPVIITRVDGHSIWVNSKTLFLAGIGKDTKNPQGGEILRFSDGDPTGILKENAEALVKDVKGPEMVTPGARSGNSLEKAIKYANKLGLTSVTTSGGMKLINKLKNIEKRDGLTLRFNVWITPEEMRQCIKKGVKFNSGNDKIKLSFVKIFSDGSLGSVSAAFFKPYKNRPETSGILIHPVKELNKLISDAHRNNWQVGVHAIGNRAVHLVLNAVELAQKKYGLKGLRHRIEHTQFITDDDIPRFTTLKMIPSMQPTHCTTDLLVVEERIGKQRGRQGYRWNSFKKQNILLAFGTDWPVEPLDPRRGLYSSVERKNIEENSPEKGWFQQESVSIEDAVRYYTFGSAFASFNENRLGSIEKGKLADLTIFDGDLSSISPRDYRKILEIPIHMTIMDGKVVYKKKTKK